MYLFIKRLQKAHNWVYRLFTAVVRAIWSKERKRKHYEVTIAVSNPVFTARPGKTKNKKMSAAFCFQDATLIYRVPTTFPSKWNLSENVRVQLNERRFGLWKEFVIVILAVCSVSQPGACQHNYTRQSSQFHSNTFVTSETNNYYVSNFLFTQTPNFDGVHSVYLHVNCKRRRFLGEQQWTKISYLIFLRLRVSCVDETEAHLLTYLSQAEVTTIGVLSNAEAGAHLPYAFPCYNILYIETNSS
jgi:hypothetical protein